MMNTTKKIALTLAAAAAMSAGLGGMANAAPAGPVNGTSGIAYQIDAGDVCREQYQRSDAWAMNQSFKDDNFSLQCYGTEGPFGINWPHLGNLDIQAYCSTFFGGSTAKPIGRWADPTNNWFCVY